MDPDNESLRERIGKKMLELLRVCSVCRFFKTGVTYILEDESGIRK